MEKRQLSAASLQQVIVKTNELRNDLRTAQWQAPGPHLQLSKIGYTLARLSLKIIF